MIWKLWCNKNMIVAVFVCGRLFRGGAQTLTIGMSEFGGCASSFGPSPLTGNRLRVVCACERSCVAA